MRTDLPVNGHSALHRRRRRPARAVALRVDTLLGAGDVDGALAGYCVIISAVSGPAMSESLHTAFRPYSQILRNVSCICPLLS